MAGKSEKQGFKDLGPDTLFTYINCIQYYSINPNCYTLDLGPKQGPTEDLQYPLYQALTVVQVRRDWSVDSNLLANQIYTFARDDNLHKDIVSPK